MYKIKWVSKKGVLPSLLSIISTVNYEMASPSFQLISDFPLPLHNYLFPSYLASSHKEGLYAESTEEM